jgi:hypothetical protein
MPVKLPWIQFAEIAKKYGKLWSLIKNVFLNIVIGPVISFNAAGLPVIVLNNHRSAYELLGANLLPSAHALTQRYRL